MSLDKAIKHGKEKRKEYNGSKAVDPSCRNHGNCVWCKRNRLHKYTKYEVYKYKDVKNFVLNDD